MHPAQGGRPPNCGCEKRRARHGVREKAIDFATARPRGASGTLTDAGRVGRSEFAFEGIDELTRKAIFRVFHRLCDEPAYRGALLTQLVVAIPQNL